MFDALLLVAALFIAGCSAYFSVYGISHLFINAFWPVVLMASSLEAGKLVAASFLHKYWKGCYWWLKGFLSIVVVILICITSMGVFGFLSAAYSGSSSKITTYEQKVEMLANEKKYAQEQIASDQVRIDALAKARLELATKLSDHSSSTLVRSTTSLVTNTDKEMSDLRKDMEAQLAKIKDFNEQSLSAATEINTHGDIGSFKFIADATGLNINTIVKWFILVLVCIFDPLAVSLVLALNFSIEHRKQTTLSVAQVEPATQPAIVSTPIASNEITTTPATEPVIQSVIEVKKEEEKIAEVSAWEPLVTHTEEAAKQVVLYPKEAKMSSEFITGQDGHPKSV